nr:hypothetical protein Iba_scaffold40257CG0010 [Ipomoea batatas]
MTQFLSSQYSHPPAQPKFRLGLSASYPCSMGWFLFGPYEGDQLDPTPFPKALSPFLFHWHAHYLHHWVVGQARCLVFCVFAVLTPPDSAPFPAPSTAAFFPVAFHTFLSAVVSGAIHCSPVIGVPRR